MLQTKRGLERCGFQCNDTTTRCNCRLGMIVYLTQQTDLEYGCDEPDLCFPRSQVRDPAYALLETRQRSNTCALARPHVAERRKVIRGHGQSGCWKGEGEVLRVLGLVYGQPGQGDISKSWPRWSSAQRCPENQVCWEGDAHPRCYSRTESRLEVVF